MDGFDDEYHRIYLYINRVNPYFGFGHNVYKNSIFMIPLTDFEKYAEI